MSKKGNVVCSDACWLKNPQQPSERPKQPRTAPTPNNPDWEGIRARKEAEIAHLNAKNIAASFLVAAMRTEEIVKMEDALALFHKVVERIEFAPEEN